MNVLIALPHYFKEVDQATYGSDRRGQRQARSIALFQCFNSLLAMQKNADDLILNISAEGLQSAGSLSERREVTLEIHVFTDGINMINSVLNIYKEGINVHTFELANSRHLPLKARDHLIENGHAYDLCLYMEDDLIIRDSEFLDKQIWFIKESEHRAVLMPHRTEWVPNGNGQRLLVDGPLKKEFIERFYTPKCNAAQGTFKGRGVIFDQSDNPHSGLFCISGVQAKQLATLEQPVHGFIGPLETAATLTVLRRYLVLKPAWKDRDFLWIEHGHPSFRGYCSKWSKLDDSVEINENERPRLSQ
ncbi:hypothetical protein ACLM45_08680 [Synechococcus sp. A10-1-5-9]|uniref:hypothetical protein n=1 Tax=Synechococcus sp. A10-1-5-9 TaxID=3392295 RepID=UPI0039EBA9F2